MTKNIIITGASHGIGAAAAIAFAETGYNVGINYYKDCDGAEATAAKVRETGMKAKVYRANVSHCGECEAMMEKFIVDFGPVDVLINNAGVTHLPAAMEQVSEVDFDRVFAVNCKSVYLTARHVVPAMKAQGSGAILNIASTAGVSPRPRLNWYNASKGWMITATKTMAIELAPSGIRVNAINPVAGETPLLKTFMGEDTPEMRAKFLSTIPLGRFSQPEDMGNAACFLCSDEASMITGVAMEVDGGRCI